MPSYDVGVAPKPGLHDIWNRIMATRRLHTERFYPEYDSD